MINIGVFSWAVTRSTKKREFRPRKQKPKDREEILVICKKILSITQIRTEVARVSNKTGISFSCLILKLAEAIYYSALQGQVVDETVVTSIARDLEQKTSEAPKPKRKWQESEITYFKLKFIELIGQYQSFT